MVQVDRIITIILYVFTILYFDLYVSVKQKRNYVNKLIAIPQISMLPIAGFYYVRFYHPLEQWAICLLITILLIIWTFKHRSTTIPGIVRVAYSTLLSRYDSFFLNLFILLIFSLLDVIAKNLVTLMFFYIYRLLGLQPKPVLIRSKGLSINSHWHVAVGNRTFELFKKRKKKVVSTSDAFDATETSELSEEPERERETEKQVQESENTNEMVAVKQRHGRIHHQKKLRFFDLLFIPFVQRGLEGMYFGNNIELHKNYRSVFDKEVSRNEYKLFFNDCHSFCHHFSRTMGIQCYTVEYRRFLICFVGVLIGFGLRNIAPFHDLFTSFFWKRT